ncbi:uncharacterized protein LOC133780171 [Humulus lupulus]|uniref:uncharacterized protein LOC133780171 n=1 Tax=Humulus lupulus TaxID=3486 RepID=UPI002B4170D7|nr:uncharacterized protein LOC133780171 [Humulus lupulus]
MADQGTMLSPYDFYDDGPLTDSLSIILNEVENPTLLGLPAPDHIGGQASTSHDHHRHHHHQHHHHTPALTWDGLPVDANLDPGVVGSGSYFEQGPPQIHDDHQETNNNNTDNNNLHDQENFGLLPQIITSSSNDNNGDGGGGGCGGNSRLLHDWPPPPVPFNCSCCQVLREIIHVNEFNNYMKLEIHGRLGMICHALCETRTTIVNDIGTSTSHNPQFEMFDFCRQSTEEVKQFLVKYCSQRKIEGYVMLNDPLSPFYEALCVGLEWDDFSFDNDFDFFPTSPLNSGQQQQQPEQTDSQPEAAPAAAPSELERNNPRITLAEQRQRTGRLTLVDLREYLHLTIEEAAKAMNVCPTVLKKICRRSGLHRWPHRKIRSIKRKISSLRPSLESNNPEIREQAQAEIDQLRQEATNICGGVDIVGL